MILSVRDYEFEKMTSRSTRMVEHGSDCAPPLTMHPATRAGEVIHDDVSLKFETSTYVTAQQAPPSLLDRGENEKEAKKQKDSENETEEIADDTETGLEDEIEDKTKAENDLEVKNMAPWN